MRTPIGCGLPGGLPTSLGSSRGLLSGSGLADVELHRRLRRRPRRTAVLNVSLTATTATGQEREQQLLDRSARDVGDGVGGHALRCRLWPHRSGREAAPTRAGRAVDHASRLPTGCVVVVVMPTERRGDRLTHRSPENFSSVSSVSSAGTPNQRCVAGSRKPSISTIFPSRRVSTLSAPRRKRPVSGSPR